MTYIHKSINNPKGLTPASLSTKASHKNPSLKKWIPIPTKVSALIELEELLDIDEITARLFARQNIHSKTQADRFLNPSLEQLHDPFRMRGMHVALERIHLAINRGERILLYGDYDVDGVSSVSLLYQFLSAYTTNLSIYIPDRYKEGYGLSMQGIDYAAQNNIDLIITVDCGIKAVAPVSAAKLKAIDCIICDHHLPGEKLPDAIAILNPKQANCHYPYKELSGCGIAFKLIQAFATSDGWTREELVPFLDLVAVSIAADLVPITGENRVLTYFGLKQLNNAPRVGLAALIAQGYHKDHQRIEDIVFGIGPMLNAAGRIADAKLGVQTLLTQNPVIATEYARQLEQCNKTRKAYDKSVVKEAKAIFESFEDWQARKSIVLYDPKWHKGVLGIAAARLVDHYFRPTIILTESNGKVVGSARSIPGYDLYASLESCKEYLEAFGGHAYAAGITLSKDKVGPFIQKFEEVVTKSIEPKQLNQKISYFTEIKLAAINPSFWQTINAFAPFGPGNRNPVFISRNVRDTGHSRLLKQQHLRLHIQQSTGHPITAIAFYQGQHFERIQQEPFDICYTVKENYWNGKVSLQLNIKDIRFPSDHYPKEAYIYDTYSEVA